MDARKKLERFRKRFQSRIAKQANGCWLWTGSVQRYGKLLFEWEGVKIQQAHRAAWFLAHGKLPKLNVLHSCDNPPCVNPDHLFEGTQADNMDDAKSKGRMRGQKGEKNRHAKLTAEQVLEVRAAAISFKRGDFTATAKRLGISLNSLRDILQRKHWVHI